MIYAGFADIVPFRYKLRVRSIDTNKVECKSDVEMFSLEVNIFIEVSLNED